jgi:methylmalonyl-CoA epimerase
MKTNAIRHVGIAAENAQQMTDFFVKVFGGTIQQKTHGEADHMDSTFVQLGDELLEIMQPEELGLGTIGKYIDKKGQGLHHISLDVDNIDELIENLKKNDIPMLGETLVTDAFGTHKMMFIHPKACGILIEVVQYNYKRD